jgi:hypothetical protein
MTETIPRLKKFWGGIYPPPPRPRLPIYACLGLHPDEDKKYEIITAL